MWFPAPAPQRRRKGGVPRLPHHLFRLAYDCIPACYPIREQELVCLMVLRSFRRRIFQFLRLVIADTKHQFRILDSVEFEYLSVRCAAEFEFLAIDDYVQALFHPATYVAKAFVAHEQQWHSLPGSVLVFPPTPSRTRAEELQREVSSWFSPAAIMANGGTGAQGSENELILSY